MTRIPEPCCQRQIRPVVVAAAKSSQSSARRGCCEMPSSQGPSSRRVRLQGRRSGRCREPVRQKRGVRESPQTGIPRTTAQSDCRPSLAPMHQRSPASPRRSRRTQPTIGATSDDRSTSQALGQRFEKPLMRILGVVPTIRQAPDSLKPYFERTVSVKLTMTVSCPAEDERRNKSGCPWGTPVCARR